MTIEVSELPEFGIHQNSILLCTGAAITLSVINAKENYSYIWKDKSGAEISTESFIEVTVGGHFTVTASNARCEKMLSIEVVESDYAVITDTNIKVVENSENNSVAIISIDALGIGDYEFALDNETAVYRDEAYFEGLSVGKHILYVRDKNGCGVSYFEFSILGFPKFFTPNNDGFHDFWKPEGLENLYANHSKIWIYDRYGKLIKQIRAIDGYWDGTFNGFKMPNSDYWYVAELISQQGKIKTYKGHFSLVR
ncbi:MAG: T9SS type B sorting domain-containing protein [Aestuariibaculum sp.]